MDERKRKEPIKLMSLLAFAVAGLLILYILSSGPTRMLAVTHSIISVSTLPGEPPLVTVREDWSLWWTRLYAPLIWVAQQPWGEPLVWYWSKIPWTSPRLP